jgi:hypothetical protein
MRKRKIRTKNTEYSSTSEQSPTKAIAQKLTAYRVHTLTLGEIESPSTELELMRRTEEDAITQSDMGIVKKVDLERRTANYCQNATSERCLKISSRLQR